MPKIDPLRFIADHAGMTLVDAILEAYKQGQQDAQPEIVRCKECKHYRQYDDQDDLCVYTMTSVEAEGYCSYAERRTE